MRIDFMGVDLVRIDLVGVPHYLHVHLLSYSAIVVISFIYLYGYSDMCYVLELTNR